MKRKYLIKDLTSNKYFQNKGRWTINAKIAKQFDDVGAAEDDIEPIIGNKIIDIIPVSVKE